MNGARFAAQLRMNILRALPTAAEMQAELMRPEKSDDPFAQAGAPEKMGSIKGYRYIKRDNAAMLGLAGELADCFDSEWFMDFEQKCEIQVGDLLQFDSELRRVKSVRSGTANIYKICRLEAVQ